MNTEVRWTDQAVADLQAIREFITRDSPRYGRLVAERLFTATERLETLTLSGRIVPELGRDDVREIIVGEYRLVYKVSTGAVIMLTILAHWGPIGTGRQKRHPADESSSNQSDRKPSLSFLGSHRFHHRLEVEGGGRRIGTVPCSGPAPWTARPLCILALAADS